MNKIQDLTDQQDLADQQDLTDQQNLANQQDVINLSYKIQFTHCLRRQETTLERLVLFLVKYLLLT